MAGGPGPSLPARGQRARRSGKRVSNADGKEPAGRMIAFRALIRKDILLFLADPRALIMSFAAPIAIASFFGYALGGAGNQGQTSKIPVLLVDQDGSAVSREISSRLNSEKALAVEPSTAE